MTDGSSVTEYEIASEPSTNEQQKIRERLRSSIGPEIQPPIADPNLSKPVKIIAPVSAIVRARQELPNNSSQKSSFKKTFGV